MIKTDENALICDLAETYGIYNYREIAPLKVAIFSIGLRDDSRIKMKITNQKTDYKTVLLAKLVDNTNLLLWKDTRDGRKGINIPKSIIGLLFDEDIGTVNAFKSGKDFEIAKNMIISGKEE